ESVVHGRPVDVAVLALRHGVDEKELGPLVAYGRKAWAELRDAFPLPETEVEVEWDGTDMLRLVGHIDVLSIVEKSARLIDWKSNRKDADYYAQLAGYAATLIVTRGLKEATATVVWLRSQQVETYRFTLGDALQFFERFGGQLRSTRYTHGEH